MKEKYKEITFIWMLLLINILFQKNLMGSENQSLKKKIDIFVENEHISEGFTYNEIVDIELRQNI